MINNGAYIHSDDIKNEKTFNIIVSAATEQNINCNWSWSDYQAVQEDNKITRLVARMDFQVKFIDIESSPFPNRTRYKIEEWVNTQKSSTNSTNKNIIKEKIDAVMNFNDFMRTNAHEICGFNRDEVEFIDWKVHATSSDVFVFNFFQEDRNIPSQKVRRSRIEKFMENQDNQSC